MLERSIEKLLFASRWLLAPLYLGLSLALIALGVKYFIEIAHSLTHILEIAETDLVLHRCEREREAGHAVGHTGEHGFRAGDAEEALSLSVSQFYTRLD